MQPSTENQFSVEVSSEVSAGKGLSVPSLKTPEELAVIVSSFALSGQWIERVRLRVEDRWYERLHHGPDHDIWAISWMPGQSTGFHDHGNSAGAFVVVTGQLEEQRPDGQTVPILPGRPTSFGPEYVHDVGNTSLGPAVSIHAYSPPLNEMNEYELDGAELVARERESERAEALDQKWQVDRRAGTKCEDPKSGDELSRPHSSIEKVLSAARARLSRRTPQEAYAAVLSREAVLVDIRPESQRALEGNIDQSLVVERNVLEWRFDPASDSRLPIATSHDLEVIVFCSEGYTSSLAAAALKDIGLWRATDVIGGFKAWREAGLPTESTCR